ncbi:MULTISPECIES: N-acetylmuramoyl-L-alanine amidase [unclassified Streptomyces]|uniref:N-acetylmuramoyl-L-alanine amidase n=1 Tax=unclassified Streptomyces TaxID=2593676 RepID=UPI000701B07F|nr:MULTISPECIES: N-acetylmuramoyl-L-alanine amidase [unclassified Streptomyces]KQX53734.1 N-acetylmuramoyl-L-alanine amidase [Streptomyces sp. Root1304]KRA90649.1 N-acetylmuramoyl-L-alanine amidase [Streptomyces sp. Root66D1]
MTQRHRRDRKKRRLLYGAAAAVVATATIGTIAVASPSLLGAAGDTASGKDASLQSQFANAAREFDVPQSVLMAVSYRQTRWESHDGLPSTTGAYNVMGLTKVDPEDIARDAKDQLLHLVNGTGDPAVDKKIDKKKALAPTSGETVDTDDPTLHTLDKAAELIDSSTDAVQGDSAASIRAGAALLAEYQKQAGAELSDDAGDWYPAVARYSQSENRKGADQFAKRVFESIRTGEREITADGEQVVLPADPSVEPVKPANVPLAASTAATTADPAPECPTNLVCSFIPAAYAQDLGNYNIADRGTGGYDIRQIVIHDIEGSHDAAVNVFKDPQRWASAHYIVRNDGRVTQMVETKNEAFHANNKTVNMHSVGIEHEGYAIKGGGGWYTEPQYESSAALVKYLANRFSIPLDREHIIGHDEAPSVLDSVVQDHWDPGPFWDWNRFMGMVGAPTGAGNAGGLLQAGQLVRIVPPFTSANQATLAYTEDGTAKTTPSQPVNFGYLYSEPVADPAKALTDPYFSSGWSQGSNWANKVTAGGTYVVAESRTDWTAVWFGGKKAWFSNPGGQFTAPVGTTALTALTAKDGATSIPVYGRAYPEDAAYTGTGVPVQANNNASLSKYSLPAGQVYAKAGAPVAGDYYYSAYNTNGTRVVGKTNVFIPIRYNHRLAYVKQSDVKEVATRAPVTATNRYNLLARDTAGVLWQYQGTGNVTTPYLTRYRISAGWNTYDTVTPMTALRADGTGDIMARDTTGIMWYFPGSGNASMPFKSRIKVSAGWQIYDRMVGVRDLTGDGKADLLAREKSGVLWLFKGTGTPSTPFAPRVKVSAGWTIYNELVGTGDLTGDGKPDVLARDTSGGMWLFKGTGTSTLFQPRVKISNGWQTYVSMVGPSDVNKDGKVDFTGRDTAGVLWTLPGTGTSTLFSPRVRVGGGWQIYNLIF